MPLTSTSPLTTESLSPTTEDRRAEARSIEKRLSKKQSGDSEPTSLAKADTRFGVHELRQHVVGFASGLPMHDNGGSGAQLPAENNSWSEKGGRHDSCNGRVTPIQNLALLGFCELSMLDHA